MKFKLPASANEEGPQPPHPSPLQLLGPFHISLILHFIALGTLHHWILSPPYLDIWIFHLELTVKNNLSDPVKHLCWSSPPDQTFNFTYMACHVDNMKTFFSLWDTLYCLQCIPETEEKNGVSQSCQRRGIPELIISPAWPELELEKLHWWLIMMELKVSTVQDTLWILKTASSWFSGVLHSSPTPAMSLTELPLGRQSSLRCAPIKPFGTIKPMTYGFVVPKGLIGTHHSLWRMGG